MRWSRCLRLRQYLTQGAGKVSAQELVQEGAGSYHSTNRDSEAMPRDRLGGEPSAASDPVAASDSRPRPSRQYLSTDDDHDAPV